MVQTYPRGCCLLRGCLSYPLAKDPPAGRRDCQGPGSLARAPCPFSTLPRSHSGFCLTAACFPNKEPLGLRADVHIHLGKPAASVAKTAPLHTTYGPFFLGALLNHISQPPLQLGEVMCNVPHGLKLHLPLKTFKGFYMVFFVLFQLAGMDTMPRANLEATA